MKKKFPTVSIILNTYNEEKNIKKCLNYIINQSYPKDKIEILLIDDYSTDHTVNIAQKYNVKVFYSGYRNIERAKSIGIENARGELILFLDCDVFLISSEWILESVEYFLKYPYIVGVQSIRWRYARNQSIINRYCNLYGVNDPFVFMLGKRSVLTLYEKSFFLKPTILEKKNRYVLCKFSEKNLPTLGAQGYIARKKMILKTHWKPYFFHLDACMELISKGYNTYVLTNNAIEHNYVDTFGEFYKKLYRNISLFLKLKQLRSYKYNIGSLNFYIAIFLMITIFVPLLQSIRGYIYKKDIAWFLHPLFCFTVPFLYLFVVIKFYYKKIWN